MLSATTSDKSLKVALLLGMGLLLSAQVVAQDNPYQVEYYWGELPSDRPMGVVTGVQPDPDGEHIWIVERCSANQCGGSDHHPIHKLDKDGNTVKSIGAGLFAWPHGFDMDLSLIHI